MSSRVLLMAALLSSGTALVAEEVRREFKREFDVQPGDRLHLEHGDGEVFVEPWSEDRLEVEVIYAADVTRVGLGRKLDFDVEFRRSGTTIHVIGRETGWAGVGFFSVHDLDYRYTVRAPSYLALDLEGEDGDVEIAGWRSEIVVRLEDGDVDLMDLVVPNVDLQLEDGDLTIEGFEGELRLTGEDGNVRVSDCAMAGGRVRLEDGDAVFSRCSGSGRFDLDDGDLYFDDFRPAGVGIRTEDGDVELSLLASDEMDLQIRTGDGDVVVDLAKGISTAFSVDTRDGGIRVDLPGATNVSRRDNRVTGRLGEGAGRLDIESGDGRVVLRGPSG